MSGPAELFGKAQAAIREGRPQEALRLFRAVAALAADDASALIHAGHLAEKLGEAAAAERDYRAALLRQPGNATATGLLADLLAKRNAEAALTIYRRAHVLAPRHPHPPASLARLLSALDRPAQALGWAARAVRNAPGDPARHGALGEALHKTARMAEATVAFRRQAALSPATAETWFNLAVTEPLIGHREAGLAAVGRCLILKPLDENVWRIAARQRRRLAAPDAAKALRKALLLAPATPECLGLAARSGGPAGRGAAARWWWTTAGLEPGLEHARALIAEGRAETAIEVLEAIETEGPASEALALALGAACRAAGRSLERPVVTRYEAWIEAAEPSAPAPFEGGTGDPLVSILMPVYNPVPDHLAAAIASVERQTAGNWELCIADDASTDRRIAGLLAEAEARDRRIRVVRRAENGHISAASNSALAIARGAFVGLLDHDDEFAPDAVATVTAALRAAPALDLIFSDEDKIDGEGRRYSPHFKPAWDPDLSLVSNYICHFTVLRRSLVEAAGSFRLGLEGSQDHDLVQRVAELTEPGRIAHIPRVLYHWRADGLSTALSLDAKPYAMEATGRVIRDALARRGISARVERRDGHWRLIRPLPSPAPRVGVIVPTRDRLDMLRRCVDGVLAGTDYPGIELVVVDNGSVEATTLGYLDALAKRERVTVLRDDGPFNFSRLCNLGAAATDAAMFCFLNNDVEPLTRDWLETMVGEVARPEIGLVGAKLLYPDGRVQHAGVILSGAQVARHVHLGLPAKDAGYWGRASNPQRFAAVTGAAMVLRREVFESVGGFDESFAVDFGDIDLCLRIGETGKAVLWTPYARLIHHESASRGTFMTPEKAERYERERVLMLERWGGRLFADPAHNPNLTLGADLDPFEPADPPRRDLPLFRLGL